MANANDTVRQILAAKEPRRESLVAALIAKRDAESTAYRHALKSDESLSPEDRERFGTPLSPSEYEALSSIGFDPYTSTQSVEATNRAVAENLADLLLASLTIEKVAGHLNAATTDVQSRANARTLYSLRHACGVDRFPAFQFVAAGVLPGFDVVSPSIPESASPLAVARFFSQPNVDLVSSRDDDQTLTPIAWLKNGADPQTVSDLVRWL